jgi:hypothetical protein
VLDDRNSSVPERGKRSFSSPQHQDQLWSPPASYPMENAGSFSGGKEAGGKMITHLQLMPGSSMVELCLYSLIRLHDVVLN